MGPADLEQLSRQCRDPERRLTARPCSLVAAEADRKTTRAWPAARSGQIAAAGGLPCGVDWMAAELPAPLALGAVRRLAAAALAFLGDLRCGVRALPVLTVPAARLAHWHTCRDSCRGRHQGAYLE